MIRWVLIGMLLSVLISTTIYFATYPTVSHQTVVIKITDGDTVWVAMHGKRVKLRLLGIDTPEEYPSRKMDKDIEGCHTTYKQMRKLGLLATKHAKTMLYKGERVTVVTKGKGYYGRTLVFIILPEGIKILFR